MQPLLACELLNLLVIDIVELRVFRYYDLQKTCFEFASISWPKMIILTIYGATYYLPNSNLK